MGNNHKNLIGAGGEYFCGMELMRPVSFGRLGKISFLFDAVLLGGKEPTYDYLVYLLDLEGDRCGPFFFLQVKTTMRAPEHKGCYALSFTAVDVARAGRSKTPYFLALVDRSVTGSEKVFVRGVDPTRSKGISRLDPRHDLANELVKIEIYKEVSRLWTATNARVEQVHLRTTSCITREAR